MKKIFPFFYLCDNNIIYKRKKYIGDGEVMITFIIWYNIDFLSYYTIKKEYYIVDYSNSQVDNIITGTIRELNKMFK